MKSSSQQKSPDFSKESEALISTPDTIEFQYRDSRLSNFLISLLYPKSLRLRIGRLIGKEKTVFEIAAGYGRFVTFLDPSNFYQGIDINPVFLRGAERRGEDIAGADIFEPESYRESDVVLLIDAVHHVEESLLPEFFDMVFAHARERVVIVEPAFPSFSKKYGIFGLALDRILLWLHNDGLKTTTHWFTPAKYQTLFRAGFDSPLSDDFALHYEKLAHHHIAVYERIE